MKFIGFLLLMASSFVFAGDFNNGKLVIDELPGTALPKNFRTTRDPFTLSLNRALPRIGLENLNISASGQFSLSSIQILKKYSSLIWIVDLRRESHGFVNEIPISWYFEKNKSNENLSCQEVEVKEKEKLLALAQEKNIQLQEILKKQSGHIQKTRLHSLIVKKVVSEKELTSTLGWQYLRLPVLDHHAPDEEVIETFIVFVKQLPSNSWVHFHCRAGRGRSTLFMVLYDILKTASSLSLDDIVARHHALGGSNLLNLPLSSEKAWKKEAFSARHQFLENFYRYATAANGYQNGRSWKEWQAQST